MMLRFSHPQYLLLLPVVLAFTWWVLRGSLADLERARRRLATGLRTALLLLLVLTLAGIQIVRPTTTLCTVFVVDVSESIDRTSGHDEVARALDYIRQAIKTKHTGDRFALVAFGADAILDHAPEDRAAIGSIISTPTTSRTDIAAGIQLAMASFPAEAGKQIVLFSDGNENLGNAIEQAGLALTSDVHISVVPLQRDTTRGEALLLRADVSPMVKQGAPFQVSVVAESLRETEGTITLYRNQQPVETRRVHLPAGKTVIAFEQSVPMSGQYQYRALLATAAGQDTVPDNNVADAYTRVAGKPKVLVVEDHPGDGAHLARALRANDLLVELGGPPSIPARLPDCAKYDSIFLVNVPAWHMSPAQMLLLQSAVRDTGMGLAMVGGDQSFGAGGYYHTPIEAALPVSMDLKKQKTLPSLTLVIVIDISGSMSANEDGVPKIRLASEAAAAAVQLLQPVDRVSIMGFDTRPVYVVRDAQANNKGYIIAQTHHLEPGGGGILAYDSLKEAYAAIRTAKTQIKHVILCADAADTEAYSEEERVGSINVAAQMKREKISLSVIGFGQRGDPDIGLQQRIAQAAGGNWYLAERLSNLPQIFTRDVMFAAKSLLVEEPFQARPVDTSHPAFRGIPWETAPPLLGYVATSMKETPSARLLLHSPKDDPVLAAWQYGLGRSVAFTSDAAGHWGVHWLGWDRYAPFWVQAARWTLRQQNQANFQTTLSEEHGRATIVVDAVTTDGEFRNLLDLRAHVAHLDTTTGRPQATHEEIALSQTAPGRYEASFEARQVGSYVVVIEERQGLETRGTQTLTLAIPYSPEFQTVHPNTTLLAQIAARAQGVFDPPAADIFGRLRFGSRLLQDIWPSLLCILACLLLVDVAVRRILLPWQEVWDTAWTAVVRRLPAWRFRRVARPRAHSVTLDTLLTVKVKGQTPEEQRDTATDTLRRLREKAPVRDAAPPPVSPPVTPPRSPAVPPTPTSTTSALLRKKRDRGQE